MSVLKKLHGCLSCISRVIKLVLLVDPQIKLDDYVDYEFVLVWFLQQEEIKVT